MSGKAAKRRIAVALDASEHSRRALQIIVSIAAALEAEIEGVFVEDADLASFLAYRREGSLSLGKWLRSFSGVEESAWFAVDDLRPLWPLAMSVAKRKVKQWW